MLYLKVSALVYNVFLVFSNTVIKKAILFEWRRLDWWVTEVVLKFPLRQYIVYWIFNPHLTTPFFLSLLLFIFSHLDFNHFVQEISCVHYNLNKICYYHVLLFVYFFFSSHLNSKYSLWSRYSLMKKENTYDLVMWEGPLTRKRMIVLTLE